MENLDNLFEEEEARLLAEGREEIATMDALWAALSQAERDAIIAEREARLAAFVEDDDEDYDDEDYDDDEDDEY